MGHTGFQTKRSRLRFRDLFGTTDSVRVAVAPGRVNLIGEHTDYNDGWVFPMAIDRYIGVTFAQRSDPILRAHSVAFDETRQVALTELESARGSDWFSYVAGMAWAMKSSGLPLAGLDLVVDGNVPVGSGLSSSAALEMATGRALCEVAGIGWHPKKMAQLGQKAENDFVGVNCGLMDQMASAVSQSGCALLLDCRSLDTEAVTLPMEATIVVMDTGSRRSLAASTYNDRRASCERAVEILRSVHPDIRALRDVDRTLLESVRSLMDNITFRRAVHVVEENLRPRDLAAALQEGNFELAGHLMNASHASLRDLYGVSGKELNLITDLARRHPGCFGARLTGAGFGGCAVALVDTETAEAFIDHVHASYTALVNLPSEFFACSPVDGAHLMEPSSIAEE
jgi:galactokinase